MACSLKTGCLCLPGCVTTKKPRQLLGLSTSNGSLSFPDLSNKSKEFQSLSCNFMGQSFDKSPDQRSTRILSLKSSSKSIIKAQASICVSETVRWWEKTLKPNMVEIQSAQEFVDTLKKAGDKLVVVDFYSPACGGCKSLHPKICQIAEQTNPDAAIFLKVDHEKLKPMCHAIHIHVLPFFRFYRGHEGRVCSFSCTVATIKKFKNALAKYGGVERCDLAGPAKGLEETELLKLASIGEIAINSPGLLPPLTNRTKDKAEDLVIKSMETSDALRRSSSSCCRWGSLEESAMFVA